MQSTIIMANLTIIFCRFAVMKKFNTLLAVDDNNAVLTAISLLLRNDFEKVVTLPSPVRIDEIMQSEKVDCVLLDMNFNAGLNSGNEGIFQLNRIRQRNPETPVILITAYADIELAVRGIQEGAADFIVKPWENSVLVDKVLKACRRYRSGQHKATSEAPAGMLWGFSEKMSRLRELVIKTAPTEANILITGENGTGKELLAREIHLRSGRASKQCLQVDMGSVTESLFESELFGHVKGSFTNAITDRTGKIEEASGGTLFLDEIGNLPMHLQSKLLTVLQSRKIVRVGSNHTVPVDIRLICATNRNLDAMVKECTFREDLLYRINTIHLHLPPLRERRDDILTLAMRFVNHFAGIYNREVKGITPAAEQLLCNYPWPGNIRELRHVIEKAVILSDTDMLTPDIFSSLQMAAIPAQSQPSTLEDMERVMIADAIRLCNGNLSAASTRLGITRQTLYNKMKRYGL